MLMELLMKNQDNAKKSRAERFGAELRQRRKDAGFRFAKEFARAIDVSPQYLSQIETAYTGDGRQAPDPDENIIDKISDVLSWRKADIYKVLRGTEDDDPLKDVDPALRDAFAYAAEELDEEAQAYAARVLRDIVHGRKLMRQQAEQESKET